MCVYMCVHGGHTSVCVLWPRKTVYRAARSLSSLVRETRRARLRSAVVIRAKRTQTPHIHSGARARVFFANLPFFPSRGCCWYVTLRSCFGRRLFFRPAIFNQSHLIAFKQERHPRSDTPKYAIDRTVLMCGVVYDDACLKPRSSS